MMTEKSEISCLPMSRDEMEQWRWDQLDVLLVTGDAYVDHPSFGAAVIGRVLEACGYRVGIIAQPEWSDASSLKAMGRPRLFCGITSGNLDSMLSNYTAARRKRKDDDYSEGGRAGRRPNHATVVYAQLARKAFPGLPVIIGGIEASLRRAVHYDYWEDRLRPSILLDSKADLLIYGMGERAVVEAVKRCAAGSPDFRGIAGTAVLAGAKASKELNLEDFRALPDWDDCRQQKNALLRQTKIIEAEQNPFCAKPLVQFHGERALIMERPSPPLTEKEIDGIFDLPFSRRPHPSYHDAIPAWEMVRNSITVIRGCAGGCSFCSLGLHQGKFISSRSLLSIEKELHTLADSEGFAGTVSDLGGPTANLYGCENNAAPDCRACRRPSCLYPSHCRHFKIDDRRLIRLYRTASQIDGIRHVHISSGIRMDVALRTPKYMKELIRHHVPGHLKVAPEHLHPDVLKRMRKSPSDVFFRFLEIFESESRVCGKEQYVVPYFISSFPGCTEKEMAAVEDFLRSRRWKLKQVQDFIPLPMTVAASMYYCSCDYETGRPLDVVTGLASRRRQQSQLRTETRPDGMRNGPEGSEKSAGRRDSRSAGPRPGNGAKTKAGRDRDGRGSKRVGVTGPKDRKKRSGGNERRSRRRQGKD
jgi:uncharacterized radical SAM protein YgiQ